jgi:GH15 family glucan-1,4-alpha-glucosidase
MRTFHPIDSKPQSGRWRALHVRITANPGRALGAVGALRQRARRVSRGAAVTGQVDLDLGVIGNCYLGALVDRRGRMVWCCYPRLDGDPLFCSLLAGDRAEEGGFLDTEIDRSVRQEQRYVGNTAILETVLTGASGEQVRILDFAPRYRHFERIYRPQMLIRRIEPLSGTARIRIRIRPLVGNGATAPGKIMGSNHIRYPLDGAGVRVTTDAPVSFVAEESWFVISSPVTLVLGPDEQLSASVAELSEAYYARTEDYWIEWVRYLSVPFEWQDAVIRAAIVLKLCSFEETGGIVAALTTSIPEAPDSGRNWDYRYCWLRDSYFVVQALNRLGATGTMEDFICYITNVAAMEEGGTLKPVYRIVPGSPLPESIAPSLAGYRGMGPVHIGNLAEIQMQNDSYGSVVLAAAQMFFDRRLPRPGDASLFRRLEALGAQAVATALVPDAGLWEHRGQALWRINTYSSVMCWAACDRLARIARVLDLADRRDHWRIEADRLRAVILERAWNPQINSFTADFGGDDVDASLLLLQEMGFVSASDPRFLGTLDLIERKLRRGDYLMRYTREDDFGLPRSAFVVCTFWYIDALAAVGRLAEARQIFERVLARRNHLGYLSEDIDSASGELWGNFPQTYSMVGLITSAMRLSKSWEEAFWRGS